MTWSERDIQSDEQLLWFAEYNHNTFGLALLITFLLFIPAYLINKFVYNFLKSLMDYILAFIITFIAVCLLFIISRREILSIYDNK